MFLSQFVANSKNNQMGQLFVVGLTRCACLYCLWPKLLNSGNSAPNFDRRKLNWLILCCPLLKKKDGLEGGVGSFPFTYKFQLTQIIFSTSKYWYFKTKTYFHSPLETPKLAKDKLHPRDASCFSFD
jgi:hypothetical protein